MANYTAVDDASANFQTKLYSGTGSALSVTFDGNSNLQPDFIWFKNRGTTNSHGLQDAVRGFNTTGIQSTNGSDADPAFSSSLGYVSAANSNGFTVQAGNCANASSNNYVSWNWKAANGTASNSNGSITSTVSANTTAGFSIVSYTGNGSGGSTIGHGLGVAPSMIIVKSRNDSTNWVTYQKPLGATYWMRLNDTRAASTDSARWNNTEPTSSVFTVGTDSECNQNNNTYIAYCFANVRGYSKIGSYTGTESADGAFVYTGFKPAFVIQKNSAYTGNWQMYDNKRPGFNATDNHFSANSSASEVTDNSNSTMDFCANGFKLRGVDNASSNWSNLYIYMAFAENPLVTSTGVPATAR